MLYRPRFTSPLSREFTAHLLPALEKLRGALEAKSKSFAGILKIGRTHLQDATPMSLGQEFSGYASQVAHSISRLKKLDDDLGELALGGTAVGTGINTHREFAGRTIGLMAAETGLPCEKRRIISKPRRRAMRLTRQEEP